MTSSVEPDSGGAAGHQSAGAASYLRQRRRRCKPAPTRVFIELCCDWRALPRGERRAVAAAVPGAIGSCGAF
jgi:hypothetical protein